VIAISVIVILSKPSLRSEVEALARRASRAPKSRAQPRELDSREASRSLRSNNRALGSLPVQNCTTTERPRIFDSQTPEA
jgi:hypothetical protein